MPYVGGKREARRLVGDYVLTENDVRAQAPFPDGVATGSWGIDLHYPTAQYDFRTTAPTAGVRPYPIPFRCLYSKNVENLMMAGRCMSVTHVALGSTRVMNTCGQMGVATGAAAHLCKAHATTPRGVYRDYLAELLEVLSSDRIGRPAWPLPGRPARARLTPRAAPSTCVSRAHMQAIRRAPGA